MSSYSTLHSSITEHPVIGMTGRIEVRLLAASRTGFAARQRVDLYALGMAEDQRLALVADVIKGLELGAVAKGASTFTVGRRDDGTVLEVDLGDPETVYLVSVANIERVD